MKTTTRPAPFVKLVLFLNCASILSIASLAADKPKPKPRISLAAQVAASEARARVKCPEAFKSGTVMQSAMWDVAYHYDQTKPGWRNQGDWPEQLIEIITHSSPNPEWHTERVLAGMKAEQDKIDAQMKAAANPSPAEKAHVERRLAEMKEEEKNYPTYYWNPAAEAAFAAQQAAQAASYADWLARAGSQEQPGLASTKDQTGAPKTAVQPPLPVDGVKESSAPKVPAQFSTRVDLIKENGVFKVPVQLNGAITLKFVVDSGASAVQIPKDVFSTLIRAETIKESDYLPGETFLLADGSKVKSGRFILRSIKVGESTYSDVEASIGGTGSMLLLGQSFLSRFKEVTTDYPNAKLILVK